MKSKTDTPAGEVAQPRIVHRCMCDFQKEKEWGYHLWKWIGGRKSWSSLGTATHIEDVVKYAADKKLKTVLIKCKGCGSEMLREYPVNVKALAPATGSATPQQG